MKIKDSTFTIVANGFADGPAQALRDYLVKNEAQRVITVAHPLVPENENVHIITEYKDGKVTIKKYYLPHKPPYTFAADPFVPMYLPKCTAWFGFNNLACMRGLARRKISRTKKVYYWAVDFVPNRFGKGLPTRVYDQVDKLVCQKVNGRVELSEAALKGRSEYLKIPKNKLAPGIVAPMGAWLDRTPKTGAQAWKRKKVVYLGHLVERQGVAILIEALAILMKKDKELTAEIIGGGPLKPDLVALAKDLGIAKRVKFHGFVKSHEDVEKILASGTVAAAPYVKDKESFTQFADPGKLKAYLGAHLPIVLTDVPPNAKSLAQAGAAVLVEDNPQSVAEGIKKLLSQNKWSQAHAAAIEVSKEFDWNNILARTLSSLGFK